MSIQRHQLTKRRFLVGVLAIAVALPLSACGKIADKVEEAQEAAENALPTTAGRARLAEHPLSEDIAALEKKVGAEDLQVFDLSITESTFTASVQDPSKPENVDAYALDGDGTWGAPTPVELIGSGELEDNLFSADEVAWDEIDALADRAVDEVRIEGAELSLVLVKMSFEGQVEISVSIDGTRSSGQLRAKADGTFIEAGEL